MIKLIASDIDGTLVEDGKNYLNPEVLDVILELRKKGIQFAAATGRQWASIESLFNPIKERIFYLSDNGAYVGCHGRNLFLNTIDRELVNELVGDIRAAGLEVMLSGPDVVYLDTPDDELYYWMKDSYQYKVERVADVLAVPDEFIKVSTYKKHDIETRVCALRSKYESRLKMTISGEMWMDATALGVNKGAAIKLIQESLGITPEETMVFGDQLNDIEMMQQAYYSFAVGNARPEVKALARFQTDTNVNDGVLKILQCLL